MRVERHTNSYYDSAFEAFRGGCRPRPIVCYWIAEHGLQFHVHNDTLIINRERVRDVNGVPSEDLEPVELDDAAVACVLEVARIREALDAATAALLPRLPPSST